MEKLLSVIVPIYNSEKYLERCVESILNQKYSNIEVLLLDDGSDDKSCQICDEYAQKDSRVIVYHGENKGLVAVRCFGVYVAKGDFVTFVDSDDWIEDSMYFEMMKAEKQYKPEIISSGIICDNGQSQCIETDIFENGLYDREAIEKSVISIMMYDSKCHRRAVTPSVCNKIFQKQLLVDAMYGLNKELTYGEDAAITYVCVAKADSIMFTKEAWYHYCTHHDSMAASFNIDSLYKIKKFEDYMEVKFKEMGIWEQMWYQLKQYMKLFLIPAIQVIYGVELNALQYLFPFDLIKKGSQIIIYGAGKVGKSYFRHFFDSDYGEIVGWVDTNYQSISKLGYNVISPNEIKTISFDCIVIAMEGEKAVQKIRKYLEDMGISKEKIVWTKPIKVN